MSRNAQGWITFHPSETERQLLEDYCGQVRRSKADVLHERVRTSERPLSNRSVRTNVDADLSPSWEF